MEWRILMWQRVCVVALAAFVFVVGMFVLTPTPSFAAESCPNAARRVEQPFGPELPDCRAYELVSPEPVKFGGQDAMEPKSRNRARAALSGEAFTFTSNGTLESPEGAIIENQLMSRRGPDGWSTQSITPPFEPAQSEGAESAYEATAFNPELTEGLAATTEAMDGGPPTSFESGAREWDLYLTDFAPGAYQYLGQSVHPDDATSDLTHVVMGEYGHLSESIDGHSYTVSVENDGALMSASAGAPAASYSYGAAGQKDTWHAASSEDSRVYFSSPFVDDKENQLYVRVNSEMPQSALAVPEAHASGTLAAGSDAVTSLSPILSGEDYVELVAGSKEAQLVLVTEGEPPTPGQSIAGSGIPAGTEVVGVSGGTITLSAAATVTEKSEVVTYRADTFRVGEQVEGYGIAPGTTVTGVSAGGLTLSAPADVSEGLVALRGGGECVEAAKACTIEVSASQRSTPDTHGLKLARYWGASANGQLVYFTSNAELTNNAYTGEEDNAANLYQYDLENGQLTDLTVDTEEATSGAAVKGVVQMSEDGSYVYFVALGALRGPHGEVLSNVEGAEPVAGEDNMYLYHDGETRFIAMLASGDRSDWDPVIADASVGAGPAVNSAVMSASSEYLAFVSEASLTGYDNVQREAGDCEGRVVPETSLPGTENCREVFLYDAADRALTCVSCNPSGEQPSGPSELRQLTTHDFTEYVPRNVLDDGTVFFDSDDNLVPEASEARENVYEYEGGHVYPISDVTGEYESFFLDASASGSDVFFATANNLIPKLTGSSDNIGIYDARVDGGFPPPPVSSSCGGAESCKPPESAQSNWSEASAVLSGSGNLPSVPVTAGKPVVLAKKAVRCPKGKRLSRGKCVKQKRKRTARRAKKSSGGKRRVSR
jgi:hypothetical protein